MDGFFGKNVRKLVEQIVKVATQWCHPGLEEHFC